MLIAGPVVGGDKLTVGCGVGEGEIKVGVGCGVEPVGGRVGAGVGVGILMNGCVVGNSVGNGTCVFLVGCAVIILLGDCEGTRSIVGLIEGWKEKLSRGSSVTSCSSGPLLCLSSSKMDTRFRFLFDIADKKTF